MAVIRNRDVKELKAVIEDDKNRVVSIEDEIEDLEHEKWQLENYIVPEKEAKLAAMQAELNGEEPPHTYARTKRRPRTENKLTAFFASLFSQ